ncbi:hypothetical protein S40293_03112 [Stachybotrys chartarum IBT 40293]|nr:hypothetical protein S40293_03112 [Stachybotrys chartarum IBT 40293]
MAPDQDVSRRTHQQSQPSVSVLQSFVHRRQPSDGEALPPLHPIPADQSSAAFDNSVAMANFTKHSSGALGELQQNAQESAFRLGRPSRDDFRPDLRGRSASPTKNPLLKHIPSRDAFRQAKSREPSPEKPKKTKSSTNLVGLLSRPKSYKNLQKTAADDQARMLKDKENRTPDDSPGAMLPPPIFAQFTSDSAVRQQKDVRASMDVSRNVSDPDAYMKSRPVVKERPKSFQVGPRPPPELKQPSAGMGITHRGSEDGSSNSAVSSKSRRGKVFGAWNHFGHSRSKSVASSPVVDAAEPDLDPKDIDKHLEAMLDRRNIPENQRYKMRNLNDTIKMEFIRQDWAEMQAPKMDRPSTNDSLKSTGSAVAAGSDNEDDKPRRTRGKSFTFSRSKKDSTSPTKKQKSDGTLGRHFRSKSTESISSERPASSGGSSSGTNLLSKIKLQQGPADYVAYLRKVQKPELVEVGKIHKLRLLLRNETVAWIEGFMEQGGMSEILGLLNRIMEVEWREEHEDALLHENLLCLKALSTTARAMEHLHSIQAQLFPKLLHMLFDPERKGPSEFTTRNIITSVLFTYIQSAPLADRPARAQCVLAHLRDPELQEDQRPIPFVLEMRQDRPYRLWCKEVVSVTKEVFWIFLHNVNVVSLPSDMGSKPEHATVARHGREDEALSYLLRHFPQERPPVPAAPYVGGVEWDATNYLASHLDLMNAIIACTPTKQERNALRAGFRISGFERCMGGSLRLCKEKFYGSVHDVLRTWVAAAAEDEWDLRDVRYGPPPDTRSPPKKTGGGQKKKIEEAPKIEMPKLDLGLDRPQLVKDAWLS